MYLNDLKRELFRQRDQLTDDFVSLVASIQEDEFKAQGPEMQALQKEQLDVMERHIRILARRLELMG